MSAGGRIAFSLAHPTDIAPPDFDRADEVWCDVEGAVCARGLSRGDLAWMEIPRVGVFSFDRARRAVAAYPEAAAAADLIYDNFYRAALPMALQYFGYEVLHASAVRGRGGVVAFCAVSGTGKSTTVAALSRRGYRLWADDAVVIDAGPHGEAARSLAVPFRLRIDDLPVAGSGQWPRPDIVELAPAPLAALCAMRRAESPASTEVRRLSAVDAVAALLPHAYCFSLADPQRKRAMMQRYFALAARVPVYQLVIAGGLDRLHGALDLVEREVAGLGR